jgi:hypothetical protein
MKGENFGYNESDLNKGNILKPTFDTFKAYHANLEELSLSRCEVT